MDTEPRFTPAEIKPLLNGKQLLFKFDNGYGASVINNDMSYGESDEFELAVIISTDTDQGWSLCYVTGITDDVIGCLTWNETEEILAKIEALDPPREPLKLVTD